MPKGTKGRKLCSMDGCEREVAGRGLCHKHYYRWRNSLPVGATTVDLRRKPRVPCSVEGCQVNATARGWCRKHYMQWWNVQYKEANPEKVRAWQFRKYGLTAEDVASLLAAQCGRCPICDQVPDNPQIDHDHVAGHVRGILCRSCNLGLGHFQDDYLRLLRAVSYLSSVRPTV